jgi:uncharacterized repeat protein (TIGR03803 family)/T5SS/PEP-CTERM-associated repeat protein
MLDGQGALVVNHSALQVAGGLDVGNSVGNCALTVTNGGTANAGGVAYLGVNSASANNSGLVSGAGSVLSCAGELHVGDNGSGNTLTIANGGTAQSSSFCLLGSAASSANNSISVTGAGSTLTCSNELRVGGSGSGNTLTISAGGTVLSSSFGVLGFASSSSNNTAVVTDAGSSLTTLNELHVGNNGPANTLVINNGAAVYSPSPGVIGFSASSIGNTVSVTGTGSLWTNASNLFIGYIGANNTLSVSANGSVFAKSAYIGTAANNPGNRLAITNATLVVSNGLGSAPLDVRNGVLTFNGGTLTADRLLATNGGNSVVQFISGSLSAGGCTVSNNQTFAVGNGSNTAFFNLIGGANPNFYTNGYSFANGLEIRSNAVLSGCGTIYGSVTIDRGGTVRADCGDTLNFFGAVTNNGILNALNGTFINFYGPLVNNGALNGSNGNAQFFSSVQNSGALQTNNMAAKPLLATLYSFTGGTDGAYPNAGLLQASDGNLYGTTEQGGSNNLGTVFRLSPAGTFTNIHSFAGSEGAYPFLATLAQGSDGFLYGTAYSGGQNGLGTIFKINTAGGLAWWYNFGGTDGAYPKAGVIQANDGKFYGTTYQGGASYNPGFGDPGNGVVFAISSAGIYTNLHSLNYLFDGNQPEAALVQGTDGLFYGSAYIGGNGNISGTAFKVTSGGALTELLTDAGNPIGAFVQGSDGLFYGTGSAALEGGDGSVYRFNSAGAPTKLHSFTNFVGEGAHPSAGLVQGSDGNFYGTTIKGGIANTGTVFRITASGALTTLRSFTGGPDGAAPAAPLLQGLDGNFYGTTSSGGTNGAGTVFKLSVYLVPPASQLAQITRIQATRTNVAVTITSVAGKGYQLQYRSSLTSGNWSNVLGASLIGIGGPLTLNDPGGAAPAQGFYRVVITP